MTTPLTASESGPSAYASLVRAALARPVGAPLVRLTTPLTEVAQPRTLALPVASITIVALLASPDAARPAVPHRCTSVVSLRRIPEPMGAWSPPAITQLGSAVLSVQPHTLPHMGYDLHISRREHWADEEGPEISREEWEAAVADDPDLEMQCGPVEWPADAFSSALMITRPGRDLVALHWEEGEVKVKNPSDVVIAKLHQLASWLGARVQGDDGEFYDD